MRIRAIKVRNWACIESVELTGLNDGIIVLHGPNRTGKSSLVQALRSCLFDHFHDSQESVIKRAIPWRAKSIPSVCVELEVGADQYRIAKTFAKTKGEATLEKLGAQGWNIVEQGKDAARKLREIIGVEKSAAGVYQMLWLNQRNFQLPEPSEVDPTLAKSLESVLGTLITGRDIDFKKRLDKACERWFTVKTMRDKKDSPLASLETGLTIAQDAKRDIDRQWNDAESALNQFEAALAIKPQLDRDFCQAEEELSQVSTEREAISARMAQLDLAGKNRAQAQLLLDQATKDLHDWTTGQSKYEQLEKSLADAHYLVQATEDTLRQTEIKLKEARADLQNLERESDQHQHTRSACADRQSMLHLATVFQSLEKSLIKVQTDQEELDRLAARLAGPVVLTEKQIDQLRQNRKDADRLHAQLEASEIRVAIQVHQTLDCKVIIDEQAASTLPFPKASEQAWLVRQRGEFTLGEIAKVRVDRGKEDRNLEAIATQLAGLDIDYEKSLRSAQVDPLDPSAIDLLVKRQLDYNRHSGELKRIREGINQLAPDGVPALQAQRDNLNKQREAIIERRPELRDWIANQAELDRMLNDVSTRENSLKTALQQAKQTVHDREKDLARQQDQRQSIKTQIASQEGEMAALKEKLGRQDVGALSNAVEAAQANLIEAERKLRDSELTEGERGIGARYQAALQAHKMRDQRVRENEKLLLRLQTQLAGTEGLHQRRTQAEQTLADLARDHEREKLHAEAHRHLKEVFESVRQEQVRRTVGPINDRVIQWSRQLGVADYHRLDFGDALLPGGLVPAHAADGEAVGMDNESWGTLEQLSLLIRLAVGGLLAKDEPAVAILDDPLAHADLTKHRKMLEIFESAVRGDSHPTRSAGPLQLIILTCHPERFDYLAGAQHIALSSVLRHGG